jgi:hypothetical protein
MSLKLEVQLSPMVEQAALEVDDLPSKVARFIEQQIGYERSRAKPYSAEAHAIAEEAMLQAEAMREQGFDRKTVGDDLLDVFDAIRARTEP